MIPKTFHVSVQGVGEFDFRRRTLRDEIAIGAAQERLKQGIEDVSTGFARITYMLAALDVLTANAPEGWAPMEMDPLDQTTFERIGEVYGALREAEERFRAGRTEGPPDAGEGPGQVA